LVRPKSSVTISSIVKGISDRYRVILEIEWEDNCFEPQVERVVLVYNKTDVLGLQTSLGENFTVWTSNGSSVEEIRNNFKNIVYEGMVHFVPHKILRKNSDPGYYKRKLNN
jgi:hypothetical protein